jgi:hypothetical protein
MPRALSDRRLRLGRLQIYIEPRDAWVGVYVARDAVYVLLVPFLVLRWARRPAARLAGEADGYRLCRRCGAPKATCPHSQAKASARG